MSTLPHTVLRSALLRVAIVAVVSVSVLPSPASAAPSNARIEAARKQAREARAKLDDLADELEERTEQYLEIEDALAQTRRRISSTEADLERAIADLAAAESQLNRRAISIYRNGKLDIISVFVGVSDFQDLVSRIDLMRRIGSSDAAVVASVKDARERIEAARTALESRKAEQVALRNRASAKRAEVQDSLDEQESYLAGLDSKLKKLIAEERQRLERIARKKAAAARRAAARGRRAPGRDFDPARLGSSHPGVVAVARRYVNRTPYVWGGTTPAGFDCSGLVQYCYREIGISLPRTSRQQFKAGAYIPPDRLDLLEPGDMVFFGRGGDPGRIHHVGLYIGGGDMIHAPQTGQRVSITSLLGRIESRGDYVGACRP